MAFIDGLAFEEEPIRPLPSKPAGPPVAGVYFVRRCDNGLVKIGYSYSIRLRLLGLIRSHDCPLTPVGYLPVRDGASEADMRRWEREIHEHFKDARVESEWFTETKELSAFMASELQPWPTEEVPRDVVA